MTTACPDTTCPMCGIPVRIVGKTTMHYEPIHPKALSVEELDKNIWDCLREMGYRGNKNPLSKALAIRIHRAVYGETK